MGKIDEEEDIKNRGKKRADQWAQYAKSLEQENSPPVGKMGTKKVTPTSSKDDKIATLFKQKSTDVEH